MVQYPNLNIIIDDVNLNISSVYISQLILYRNTHNIPDNHYFIIEKYAESFIKDSISLWKHNAVEVRTNFNTLGTYAEFYSRYNISNFLSFTVYLCISNKSVVIS